MTAVHDFQGQSCQLRRDSCCLPSVKKQKHDFQLFAFIQCIITQLLDEVSVISRIIKVSVRVISLSFGFRLIIPTSTLIILDITKISSNNCFFLTSRLQHNHPHQLAPTLKFGEFCLKGFFLRLHNSGFKQFHNLAPKIENELS